MKTSNLINWFGPNRRRLALAAGLAVLGAIGLALYANKACNAAARNREYRSLATVPARDVGLVLGTGKTTRHGHPNLHFNRRIEAAAALYHAGKVTRLNGLTMRFGRALRPGII